MPERPYMKCQIQELEGLVANHVRDANVLDLVLGELTLRSTRKAADLRAHVEKLIRELRSTAGANPKARQKARLEKTRDTKPVAQGTLLFTTRKSTTRKVAEPRNGVSERNDTEDGEQPKRSEQVSRIRSPESATRTPAKWVPDPTETLQPTWKPSDPVPLRFERALRLLIQDIKRRGAGAQTISLEDGQRIRLDGAEHAYRFRWQGDEELFEGAAVEIIVAGKTIPGKIVSLGASELVIDADSDLGQTIRSCVLRIDNTAMLVALADRMASIAVTQGIARESVGPSAGAGRTAARSAKSGTTRNADRKADKEPEPARPLKNLPWCPYSACYSRI
jgi:hypothetical protein